jgi:plastocyanin
MPVRQRSGRGWVVVLACLAGLLLLGACSSGSGGSSAPPAASGSASAAVSSAAGTIVIKNFMFQPMSVTVTPGATVTVRNEDTVTHTLTDQSDPKLFTTGDIAAGQSKTFKAPNAAGSYSFICSIHQYMTGTIVVR